jgi:flagellar protein FlaG
MAVEVVTASPFIAPNVVDNLVAKKQPVAEVKAVEKHQPKPAPTAVKIEINREPVISAKELEAKIVELNEAMVSRNQAIVFSKDAATGKDVVRVTNKGTGELIRQMPSVEALKAMQNIDHMMGLIFNQKS